MTEDGGKNGEEFLSSLSRGQADVEDVRIEKPILETGEEADKISEDLTCGSL